MTDDLRAWRRSHKLSAISVADFLGYTPEHISRCENGTRNLSRNAWRLLRQWKETPDAQ